MVYWTLLSISEANWEKKGGGISLQPQAAGDRTIVSQWGHTKFLSEGATTMPHRFLTFGQSSPTTSNHNWNPRGVPFPSHLRIYLRANNFKYLHTDGIWSGHFLSHFQRLSLLPPGAEMRGGCLPYHLLAPLQAFFFSLVWPLLYQRPARNYQMAGKLCTFGIRLHLRNLRSLFPISIRTISLWPVINDDTAFSPRTLYFRASAIFVGHILGLLLWSSSQCLTFD